MAWLKYYEEERERHPDLNAVKVTSDNEAIRAIRKLSRHYGVRCPEVCFTSGRRNSSANAHRIKLNRDDFSWLTVIHEFCHTWDRQKYRNAYLNRRAHGKTHIKLVNRACAYARKKGWPAGALKDKEALAVVEVNRPMVQVAAAACPVAPDTDRRIAKREAQIKRLERRIKALTTRVKRARRSLGALQRSKARRASWAVAAAEQAAPQPQLA
jgi:hypothetical protein